MQGKKATDEFLEYIIESGKTKLTAEMLFEEFKSTGYYQKCIDNMTEELRTAVGYWKDEHWRMYLYNYCKLQLGIKAAFGNKEMSKIVS